MVDKTKIVSIKSRDNGTVGYSVQDLGIRRDFTPGEIKEVTAEELIKLSYQPGGKALINQCLIINDEEVLKEILGSVEPEYFYSENEIKELLLNGSFEQFLDCLDFAPIGVIDLIKKLAVELEVNDIRKREAILNKTGFNVTNAINFNKETENDTSEKEHTERRSTPIVKVAEPKERRVNIIEK